MVGDGLGCKCNEAFPSPVSLVTEANIGTSISPMGLNIRVKPTHLQNREKLKTMLAGPLNIKRPRPNPITSS